MNPSPSLPAHPLGDAWYFLDHRLESPPLNMGLDEAMLEQVAEWGAPLVRFYGWKEKAATFGYFQKYADVEEMTPLRPLIRRPTGGGLVPHDQDWTYSVAIPPGHFWYESSALESYRQLHEWLRCAFEKCGVVAELAPCCQPTGPGQCFVGAEKFDLLSGGHKIAGAAQRRNKLGLLIQGSVQNHPVTLSRSTWQQAMLSVPVFGELRTWESFPGAEKLRARAHLLAEQKYSKESYNQKR